MQSRTNPQPDFSRAGTRANSPNPPAVPAAATATSSTSGRRSSGSSTRGRGSATRGGRRPSPRPSIAATTRAAPRRRRQPPTAPNRRATAASTASSANPPAQSRRRRGLATGRRDLGSRAARRASGPRRRAIGAILIRGTSRHRAWRQPRRRWRRRIAGAGRRRGMLRRRGTRKSICRMRMSAGMVAGRVVVGVRRGWPPVLGARRGEVGRRAGSRRSLRTLMFCLCLRRRTMRERGKRRRRVSPPK